MLHIILWGLGAGTGIGVTPGKGGAALRSKLGGYSSPADELLSSTGYRIGSAVGPFTQPHKVIYTDIALYPNPAVYVCIYVGGNERLLPASHVQ